MATPNYGFEKRQKELAKRRKKEDKLRAKADRKANGEPEDGEVSVEQGTSPGNPAESTAPSPDTPAEPKSIT